MTRSLNYIPIKLNILFNMWNSVHLTGEVSVDAEILALILILVMITWLLVFGQQEFALNDILLCVGTIQKQNANGGENANTSKRRLLLKQ